MAGRGPSGCGDRKEQDRRSGQTTSGTKAAAEGFRNFDLAVLGGDLDRAMEHAHPDVTIREAPGLPYGGDFVGRDGIVELMTKVGAVWECPEPLSPKFIAVN